MRLSIRRTFVPHIKNWRWTGFALFLTLLFGIELVGGIVQNTHYTMLERLQGSFSIFGLLPLWGLALQKRIFQQLFWRLFFFIDASGCLLLLIFGQRYNLPLLWAVIIYVVAVVVTLTYYVGLFIYAFRSEQIWAAARRPRLTYPDYPHLKWARRKQWLKNRVGLIKYFGISALTICCLTFVPLIIRNNRVIYPDGMPSERYEHMLEYRRTTIPELEEFERLFPCYLCDFDYGESKFIVDPDGTGKKIAYLDPNSPVKWRLSAGLHNRYLFVMEIDIVFRRIDPKTGAVVSPGFHNEPAFSLWEVTSVSAPLVMFSERHARASRDQIGIFGLDEWRRLVRTNADFAALGIELSKDAPIPNFALAFRNNE
ncbi:MAG: hypothetical protein ACYSUC_10695 [Planctomycetota bacterium]|jgi:hypothetical protein